MRRHLPFLTAFALVITSGVVHGLWTDRWRPSTALEDALARVDQVPLKLGGWHGQAQETDAQAFERAGAQRYWSRQYTWSDKKVSVILMCGRAGRMAVHTPEVCYRGAGYEVLAAPLHYPVTFGTNQAQFWTARFGKGLATDLQLYWAWNDGHGWAA